MAEVRYLPYGQERWASSSTDSEQAVTDIPSPGNEFTQLRNSA